MTKKIIFSIFLSLMVSISEAGDDGWVDLFNGKDLSGWKQVSGIATYKVINGELVGIAANDLPSKELMKRPMASLTPLDFPRNSFLVTENVYADFIFEIDLFPGNMNGGIQFRSNSDPDYWEGLVYGYQAEVDPSKRGWSAGIFDETRRGWLYPGSFNPKARSAFKANEWNRYRIESIGNSLRTWLNGVPVAHVIDDMSPEGFIALQVHFIFSPDEVGEKIRWKNIRIKTENLTPAPPEDIFVANYLPDNLSEAEKDQGWTLLGNKDIKNINGNKQTVKSYKAFDFQFEFKSGEESKGGVSYFLGKNKTKSSYRYLIQPDNNLENAEKTGSLSGLISAKEIPSHPGAPFKREWNRGRIVAFLDGKVEHWLNEVLVLEYKLDSEEFQDLLAKNEDANGKSSEVINDSPIIIDDSNGSIEFRSLKIKSLKERCND